MRFASLAVEACLAAANVVAFAALLVPGGRAGRVAHRALTWGACAALAGALVTLALRVDAVWLMEAWRAEPLVQVFKALILAGALVSVRESRLHSEDWRTERATGPVFRLACVTGLVAAAGAGDLLLWWLACEIATAALVLEVATAGRWSQREKMVRRMMSAWLTSSPVMLLGVILLAGLGGGTRLADLEATLPDQRGAPAVIVALFLLAGSLLARAFRLVVLLGALRRA